MVQALDDALEVAAGTARGGRERARVDLVEDAVAPPRGRDVLAALAALPPLAVETIKRAADLIPEASREAAMLIERLGYAALAQTDEATKAVEDFTRRDRRP